MVAVVAPRPLVGRGSWGIARSIGLRAEVLVSGPTAAQRIRCLSVDDARRLRGREFRLVHRQPSGLHVAVTVHFGP